MRVTINNQEWTAVANGTFVINNEGGRRCYLMRAAAQPAAGVSLDGAMYIDPHDEPTDVAIAGQWWGRCDNERALAVRRECRLAIEGYA